MEIVILIIMYAAAIAYIITLIIAVILAVALLFTDFQPKRPKLSNWFLVTIFCSVVGAVAGFSLGVLKDPRLVDRAVGESNCPPAAAAPNESDRTSNDMPEQSSESPEVEASGEPKDTPQEPSSEDTSGVQSQISATLAKRPVFPKDWKASYPKCAISAREQFLDNGARDACFDALDDFNKLVILPYRDAYEAHLEDLDTVSRFQEAGPYLDFLKSEYDDLSRGREGNAERYYSVSATLGSDYLNLRNMRQLGREN